jgi:uncharacterized protein YcfJ
MEPPFISVFRGNGMTRTLIFGFVFLVAANAANITYAQSRARDGATAGAVAGAVIGGIVGHQNDETPEGIAIGGVVGAIAGGIIGDAQDQRMARENCYRQQIMRQQQVIQARAQPVRRAASISEVIQMSQSGVGDGVILNYIQSNGIERKLEVHDIISMHQQGVSETVIASMQRAPIGVPTLSPTTIIETEPSVIVHEHYHPAPRVYQAYPVIPTQPYWR